MTKSSETRFEQGEAFIAGYHAGWGAERGGPGPGKLFEEWFRDQESKREPGTNAPITYDQKTAERLDLPAWRPEHNDSPRSECPGYERSRAISIARDQLARMTGPVNVEANRLARLLLNALGEEP